MMRMNVLWMSLVSLLASCSLHENNMVVERADNLKKAPKWASVTKPSWEEEDRFFFVSFVEVDGASSASAAMNMSDEKSLAEPMRAIVEDYFELAQIGEDLRSGESLSRRVISATKGFRPPMGDLRIVGRYWERVRLSPTSTRIRAFSLSSLSKSDFERARKIYFDRLSGESTVADILDEVGGRQIDRVLD